MNKLDTLLSAFKAHCHKKGNKLWFSPTPTDIAADVRLAGIPTAWDTFSGVVRQLVTECDDDKLGSLLLANADRLIGRAQWCSVRPFPSDTPLITCMHWLALVDPDTELTDELSREEEGLYSHSWWGICAGVFPLLVDDVARAFISWLGAGLTLEEDLNRNRWGTDNYSFHPVNMRSPTNAS